MQTLFDDDIPANDCILLLLTIIIMYYYDNHCVLRPTINDIFDEIIYLFIALWVLGARVFTVECNLEVNGLRDPVDQFHASSFSETGFPLVFIVSHVLYDISSLS